ncbi:hypothetical protein K469DRAFT_692849 [Zopfia rhizophila CBS 207.26]|uniref:Uncharacterized protein n=1 Tax=Zopfia rhizophila CBS 207.26 TaxID=1314779 RepID=A0A6A6DNW3_9PEZI|nr:hypothetical protein K469DRAFT_692849 [Zopfia rhizophila CBS 207.26]
MSSRAISLSCILRGPPIRWEGFCNGSGSTRGSFKMPRAFWEGDVHGKKVLSNSAGLTPLNESPMRRQDHSANARAGKLFEVSALLSPFFSCLHVLKNTHPLTRLLSTNPPSTPSIHQEVLLLCFKIRHTSSSGHLRESLVVVVVVVVGVVEPGWMGHFPADGLSAPNSARGRSDNFLLLLRASHDLERAYREPAELAMVVWRRRCGDLNRGRIFDTGVEPWGLDGAAFIPRLPSQSEGSAETATSVGLQR